MRMASDEDYGHVGRKNKDLGIQVTPAHNIGTLGSLTLWKGCENSIKNGHSQF